MPSYEDVVLSLEADGFQPFGDAGVQLRDAPHGTRCGCCGEGVKESIYFHTKRWPGQTYLCLDRAPCRARKAKRLAEEAVELEARQAAVAAAVILPEGETFPENAD